MRADLQALLNNPNTVVSIGHELQNKMMVLGWLMWVKSVAATVNLNIPNVATKVAGLQGVNPQNMLDLRIYGLATYLGYGNYSWPQLVTTAKAAVDGGGVLYQGQNYSMQSADYQTLQNYALLTDNKVIADTT